MVKVVGVFHCLSFAAMAVKCIHDVLLKLLFLLDFVAIHLPFVGQLLTLLSILK